MLAIKQQLVSSRSKTYGEKNPCEYITIHETGNYNKGSGSQVHANLQTNGFTASWHYQVDDKAIVQSFPDNVQCWHAGDGKGAGNMKSIGIEICVNPDSDFKKAVANAADLVKFLMEKHKIPISNVVQHNRWSGKNCPTNLRNGSKGINWGSFINQVKDPGTPSKPTPSKQEDTKVPNLYDPQSQEMKDATSRVLRRLEQQKDRPISDAHRKRLEAGTLTNSQAIGLLFVALDRGHVDLK